MNKNELVDLRAALPSDRNFILATWLRGLYYGGSFWGDIPKNIFMENYHDVLDAVLARPTTRIVVACLRSDPEVILGYSVCGGEGHVIHWLFVKTAWRKIGIARSLVPNQANFATHLTKVGQSLLSKRPGMVFNPFILTSKGV